MTQKHLAAPLLCAVVASALSLAAMPALAQFSGSSGPIVAPSTPKPPPKAAPEKAPPALPGSRAEAETVTPAAKSAADMPPTEALFDSINRGDLATAKDAVNRGADLNGTNVLGLTPLELSIDLGRNQISFLLLSLRGGAGYTTANGPAATKPPGRAEQLAAQRAEKAAERADKARQRAARVEPAAPSAPNTARLFAGNGGAPIPQAGFLGFDSAR